MRRISMKVDRGSQGTGGEVIDRRKITASGCTITLQGNEKVLELIVMVAQLCVYNTNN